MAIRVTPTGEIITRGGLPSCTCCCECDPDRYEVCIRHYWWDGDDHWEDLTLTGSLCAGSFAGTGYLGDYVLEWSEGPFADLGSARWTITGGHAELSIDDWENASTRCDPIGANIADAYPNSASPEEFYVASWGVCPECFEETSICVMVRLYPDFEPIYLELTGSLTAGFFTDGTYSVYWDGVEWQAGANPEEQLQVVDRCDPTGMFKAFNTYTTPALSWDIEVINLGPCPFVYASFDTSANSQLYPVIF